MEFDIAEVEYRLSYHYRLDGILVFLIAPLPLVCHDPRLLIYYYSLISRLAHVFRRPLRMALPDRPRHVEAEPWPVPKRYSSGIPRSGAGAG
jgi:hypothetical protein